MQAAVLHRVGFSENFCPKQGKDFKPSAAPLYPNMGQVPPPPVGCSPCYSKSEGNTLAAREFVRLLEASGSITAKQSSGTRENTQLLSSNSRV